VTTQNPDAQHPDTPRDRAVEQELNESTQESMEQLGRPDLDPQLEREEQEDLASEEPAGQNSDWSPQ
jgi:hypothetical protein